jgi:hypothetical protein
MPSEVDIAWAAGLFEGEGCLTISGTRWPHARLKLNMTDEEPVRRFHDIVGHGQVRQEDAQIKYGYKRQWEWYVGNKEGVAAVIHLLFQQLSPRRQARAAELLANIDDRSA